MRYCVITRLPLLGIINFVQRHTPPVFRPGLSSFLLQPSGYCLTHPRRQKRKYRKPSYLQASGNLVFFPQTPQIREEGDPARREANNDDGRNSPRQRFGRGLVRGDGSSQADFPRVRAGDEWDGAHSTGERWGGGGVDGAIWSLGCVLEIMKL